MSGNGSRGEDKSFRKSDGVYLLILFLIGYSKLFLCYKLSASNFKYQVRSMNELRKSI